MSKMPITIDEILKATREYIHDEKSIALINKAYLTAKDKHEGQFRKSGEPYVQHPLEVANILVSLHTAPSTICAGLLHDVLEDTDMTKEEMTTLFNEDITNIVDGVTKIGKLKYMTKEKALAHNHEKLLLAMAKDIRVIIVKLADRLHNMRTIEFHDEAKQKRIAQETLDLYAPLAHRLGMYRLKAELEDTSFKVLNEEEYKYITEAVGQKKAERNDDIDVMMKNLENLLITHSINHYSIRGRIKNIYSIYKKIVTKNKTVDDIFDLLALRIIVDSVEDCYRVLGLVHSTWTPLPMRFKDYIAVPKPNLYQSLHTTVVGNHGKIFEIQIRTYEMDVIAELGVAAHWAYKENSGYNPEKEQLEIASKLKWYKDLTTYVENSDSEDPLDSIIEDIFSANIYVFTPNGDVLDFPAGSMPLDFAYRIHSDIGNKTVGAIVNGKIAPLSYKLKTGDVIEIKTNKACTGPNNSWLKLVKTNHARSKIKAYINKKLRDDLIERGKEEFEKACKVVAYNINELDDRIVTNFFSSRSCFTVEDLYWEIGKGVISPLGAVNRICGITDVKLDQDTLIEQYNEVTANTRTRRAHNGYGIIVDGLEKAQLKLGNCCQPVYGDKIYGYISKANGIIVHRDGCPNILKSDRDRFIEVNWDKDFNGKVFESTIKVSSIDKKNGVADMINTLNSTKASIIYVTSTKNKTGECITKFKLQVASLDDLNQAIINLNKLSEIYSIERIFK